MDRHWCRQSLALLGNIKQGDMPSLYQKMGGRIDLKDYTQAILGLLLA